ncbi:FCD domain-containing protein [Achromobacter denitrificans]|uniref:GntR family transcriptional regulator n=3 Tax=Achromobacter denitrificans TaxID=32002 RepID=A0A427WTM5_ACHDE|nr:MULTISPECIES: GntR family transcriptional regulator [Achromobacter]ASC65885.1 GntR family transcriptional regulator [Achromobacter denitrificans]MBV2161718.1 GntR family transcriptional regulator [Achromobacter denitrificans]MDX3878193.1 GntR family transcriptional regulator [Achromobacter sp.]OLU09497.1 GntR family transcriptional regulator [Achromobacter denitrificans]QCS64117.1 GntR family transcriptional regulator [Achromobacter denitrificans]
MSLQTNTVNKILELIKEERLPEGAHLTAQKLADRLRLSRSPVNDALGILEQHGVVTRKPNRGYFLSRDFEALADTPALPRPPAADDIVTQSYFKLADDLLRGELPMQCSEAQLRARYALTLAQTQALLARVSQEGWAHRRPGYGWEFSSMMTTPDSLLQSYRLRLALEPAALLEPTFRIEKSVLARCRAAEQHLLDGGIATDTADQLHERGVRFHESLVEASGNPFFIDTIKRVNRVRRLLSYRSMQDRSRYRQHCDQHLAILDLLERERNEDAAAALSEHLRSTLDNLARIRGILT